MIWVLLAAVFISGIWLKEYLDAAVILVIVLLNAVLGFVQESRAERAIDKLKELSAPTVKVVRGRRRIGVPARELVPGDLIMLEAGDLVAADARLVTAVNLRVNESSLTGESAGGGKGRRRDLRRPDTPLGDRCNMVFAGTHVEYGRGTARGGRDRAANPARADRQHARGRRSPRRPRCRSSCGTSASGSSTSACSIVAVVFAVGMIRGNEFAAMLLFAVSLAVAAIPEGLPAIVTITLAQGTQAMAKQNAIIRNLPAVETLGCAELHLLRQDRHPDPQPHDGHRRPLR